MFELRVAVSKVMGTCTSGVPMKRGDHFVVRDGDLSIPGGGCICMYALQNLVPVITPKERALAEAHDEDWMWRVRHVQCPDPKGRVIFTIDPVRKLEKRDRERVPGVAGEAPGVEAACAAGDGGNGDGGDGPSDLRVVVEQVKGKCTSRMKPGDSFLLRGGRLYLPPGRAFCLYALHAALPLLPAKQRLFARSGGTTDGDWMADEHHVMCPDPAGNVILRIEPVGKRS